MSESKDLLNRLAALSLFAGLSEEELGTIAGLVGQSQFSPDAIVFRQGDESDKFYLVESGKVLIIVRDEAGAEAELTRFGPGDFFGEAGLLKSEPRNATAKTLVTTTLHFFTEANFRLLLQRFPKIEKQIAQRAAMRERGRQLRFPWQMEDEVTIFAARRHWAALIRVVPQVLLVTLACAGLTFIAFHFLANAGALKWIISVLAVIVLGLTIVWHIVDWNNDYLIVTDRRVVHIERVMFFSETRGELPMDAIQDVILVRASPIATWLDYANIRIQTAGGGGHISFTYLHRPEAAQQQILQQRTRLTGEAREERRAAIRYEIEKAIRRPGEPPPTPPPAPKILAPPVPTSKPPRTFLQRLGEVAQLRLEREGQIIWRKHWLVLLSQISRPALVAIAGILLFSWIRNLTLAPCVRPALVIVIVGGILWVIWEWMDWGNDLYILTPTNIIDIESLPFKLKESRREGGLDRIQDIEIVLPSFWSNLLNIGNIRIKTAAAGGDFTFDRVYDPRGVQRDVFRQLARYRRQQDLQQRQRQFEDMSQWFSVYSEVTRPPAPQAKEGNDIGG